jgi:hypothetical protein
MAARFPRLMSLMTGAIVYAAVFAGGCVAARALAGPSEPNPEWADDKLPAAAVDGLALLFFVLPGCQIAAFGAGAVAGVWTYSQLRTKSAPES